ncbi:SDR family NAD(P)-dependent oxidoreductase [Novosphingobium resinovorum]|uniref:Cyclopentanol dehydrogenase n=1 Tax=Novosphingobium resinovorum TaxID=158500 RepID=A0A1D8AGH3_9SPHN|nr:SDR family oxidoreductase [Novosphingobium resinovorum]AOR81198.1 hypothetical protein BES08_30480 [Novosphingobium resinovorum]
MERLAGEVAIITGGARGQGASQARLFAEAGAAVAICDVLIEEGERFAAEMRKAGHEIKFFKLDVAQEHEWRGVVQAVLDWKSRISILVNNAGIINQHGTLDTSIEDWSRVMGVNITGPFLGIKHVGSVMKAAGHGSIINIGSLASFVGVKCVAYSCSKTALLGLTRTAASELGEFGIRVNAVCPGTIISELSAGFPHFTAMRHASPARRHGEIDEISKVVLFLASSDSTFVNGAAIPVDGGFTAAGSLRLVHRLTQTPEAIDALEKV